MRVNSGPRQHWRSGTMGVMPEITVRPPMFGLAISSSVKGLRSGTAASSPRAGPVA